MRRDTRKTVSLGGGRRLAALPPGSLDATRERLVHALRDGDVGLDGPARRIADPFDTMAARQTLDREDRRRNDLLFEAGIKFRRHWQGGHLNGLATLDIARERVDGGAGSNSGTPTEAAVRHRDAYAKAANAVGARLMPYLTAVVIDAQPITSLCGLVTDAGHGRTREAIATERLREALHRLVDHWRLVGPVRRPGACRG